MKKASEISLRDPFVLLEGGTYYLYGTSPHNPHFLFYRSTDLEHFEGPFIAFQPSENFWADRDFWAPEVHKYRGKYYMFASFKVDGQCRGTQILVAAHPEGPFAPLSEQPYTPRSWECLDGTFFEENGKNYSVFCHEWLQIGNGTMELVELDADLRSAVSEPVTLFHAADAPWVRTVDGAHYVTDGPFLHRMKDGTLAMLWSSYGETGYAMGAAYSTHGIHGPWTQQEKPLYSNDGGHGMIFRDLEDALRLVLHQPNVGPNEHPVFLHIAEESGILTLR